MIKNIIDTAKQIAHSCVRRTRVSREKGEILDLIHRSLDSIRGEMALGTPVDAKLLEGIEAGFAHFENRDSEGWMKLEDSVEH